MVLGPDQDCTSFLPVLKKTGVFFLARDRNEVPSLGYYHDVCGKELEIQSLFAIPLNNIPK